jgi:hypothetical protein
MTDPAVVARAEAATLGSILLQPESLRQVPWLRVHDFADPWHGRVFDLLRQHSSEPITPVLLGQWLLDGYVPAQADLPRVHTLVRAAPLRPDPVAYAQMVLAAAIRREIPAYGVLLRGSALQAALTSTAHPMLAAAALVQHTIAGAQSRWDVAHPRNMSLCSSDPESPRPAGIGLRDVLLGADRYLAAHGPLDPAAVRTREAALVAALISHPRAEPPAWLAASQLTDRRWAATYAALLELHATGHRVDEVTIAWASEHLVAVNGAGPSVHELTDAVDEAAFSDPGCCARAVAGDQLRILAGRSSAALIRAAANPGLTVPDLLDTAGAHTNALTDLATAALPVHPEQGALGQVVPLLARTPPQIPAVPQSLPQQVV